MIFNLFKSKPTLDNLIPIDFVDIHSHVLPGIDDGAKSVDESLNLISEMNRMGFKKLIATPHTYQGLYNNNTNTIKNSFNLLKNKIPADMEIKYASEYFLDSSFLTKMKEKSSMGDY